MRKILFICTIALINVFSLKAQICGTTITKEEVDALDKMLNFNIKGRTQSVNVEIPVQFHFVRQSDGSGGLSAADANDILNNVNAFYINSNMEFFFVNDVNFIDNSTFYNWNANEGVAASNDVSGVINIYFFNSINSNGTPLCGYTRFPPSSDRVFVAYGCATGGGTTLEHELGHYFTLFHTHGTTNTGTTDELVNGSNCESAGDRLCDTPADPNLSGVVSNCIYTGNATDANGQIYNPQVENIMSYAPDQCVDRFTPDQYDRIRLGFENGRAYLNWSSDEFTANFIATTQNTCVNEQISYEGIGFGVSSWLWTFEGGSPTTSTSANPTILYETGGIYDVTLTATSNSGQQVTVTKSNYIEINDPLDGAIGNDLGFDFREDLSAFNIINNDLSFTFEKSTIDKSNLSDNGSLFINNFSYQSETAGLVDIIELPTLNNAGVRAYTIEFDYAYTTRSLEGSDFRIADTLMITHNDGCSNKDDILFIEGGNDLSTVPSQIEYFEPQSSDEWRSVELAFDVTSSLKTSIFKFKNISYNGNNLYIDNIRVTADVSLDEPQLFRIVGYQDGILTIRWADVAINEFNYILLKSVNGGTPESIVLEKNIQLYEDSDISSEGVYTYSLFALGRNGVTSDTLGPITFDNTITSLVLDEDNSDQNNIKIYPNPAENIIKVESIVGEQVLSIELVDQMGRIVIKQSVKGFGTDLNVSNVQAGMYFVQLNFKNKSITKRVVIKK